jgi:hypothetical protein
VAQHLGVVEVARDRRGQHQRDRDPRHPLGGHVRIDAHHLPVRGRALELRGEQPDRAAEHVAGPHRERRHDELGLELEHPLEELVAPGVLDGEGEPLDQPVPDRRLRGEHGTTWSKNRASSRSIRACATPSASPRCL